MTPTTGAIAASTARLAEPRGGGGDSFVITPGRSPLVAVALHDSHAVRPEIEKLLALTDDDRLREEDPFTAAWTMISDARVVACRSRFEVDLNRPRDSAVYAGPADAWGLEVWRSRLPEEVVERSLAQYDAFYEAVRRLLAAKIRRHGSVVVYDLHSYNHRRDGPGTVPDDAAANPDVNVGTGSMDRSRWAPLVDRVINDLRSVQLPGRRLDVRENVKFQGGEFPTWVHRTFPSSGCAIAIEFKKFFMDEWTGRPFPALLRAILDALQGAAAGTLEQLGARS